jgi:hypothetical protein
MRWQPGHEFANFIEFLFQSGWIREEIRCHTLELVGLCASLAIISPVGSIAGLVSFIAAPMLTIAIISLVIGAASFFQIRRCDMAGTKPAIVSISLSIMTLIFAPIWHIHLFNSESLSGYIRIDLPAMGM